PDEGAQVSSVPPAFNDNRALCAIAEKSRHCRWGSRRGLRGLRAQVKLCRNEEGGFSWALTRCATPATVTFEPPIRAAPSAERAARPDRSVDAQAGRAGAASWPSDRRSL